MKQRGFTLIELMVVIAIIGLLSNIVLTSLINARAQARDATNTSIVNQLSTAMQLFYLRYDRYPYNYNCGTGVTLPDGDAQTQLCAGVPGSHTGGPPYYGACD